jgi:ABC-type multidrug transport system ATPase subunit
MSMAFDQVVAVKDLSLAMHTNEVCCLLGQNGAGKSTAINVLTGLLSPTHGEVFEFGEDLRTAKDAIREQTGVCPQDDVLFEELTAEEHLWFYGCFKGVPLGESRTYASYVDCWSAWVWERTRRAWHHSSAAA